VQDADRACGASLDSSRAVAHAKITAVPHMSHGRYRQSTIYRTPHSASTKMSHAAKLTLATSIAFCGLTVVGVHYLQQNERAVSLIPPPPPWESRR
jgi:hypothetical protein